MRECLFRELTKIRNFKRLVYGIGVDFAIAHFKGWFLDLRSDFWFWVQIAPW